MARLKIIREEVVRENFVKLYVEGSGEECRSRLANARGAAHGLLVAAGYRSSPGDS